ncbi:unnamed protein product [Darwinula stevensoni]|uniref:Condensin complex subunit 2 n=1 Tax=Darwinula stevensoni TaxID=69355 RepID=A0A7R9FQ22_9CRUS|nr:unnamed protein product [Darwinula stevensoni]CAG0898467.1 unnamed protein product [Darwinula stevensoni]
MRFYKRGVRRSLLPVNGLASKDSSVAESPDHEDHDDEAERRERIRVRLSNTSFSADKRKSVGGIGGMSNEQIAHHYSDCIRLSAENDNKYYWFWCLSEVTIVPKGSVILVTFFPCSFFQKITSKNAFSLKLIDMLSQMMQDKQTNNFQVKRKGGMILNEEENLKENKIGLLKVYHDPDPVYLRDIINSLNIPHEENYLTAYHNKESDSFKWLIQPDSKLEEFTEEEQRKEKSTPIETLEWWKEELDASPQLPICSHFNTFSYNEWDLNKSGPGETFSNHIQENDLAFDAEAVPSQMDESFGIEEFNADQENYDEDGDRLGMMPSLVSLGTVRTVGADAQRRFSTSSLLTHVSTKTLEYSFFANTVNLRAWAGPGHWKMKSNKAPSITSAADPGEVKKRKKSGVKKKLSCGLLELTYEDDFYAKVNPSKHGSSKIILKKGNAHSLTLPKDYHIDPSKQFMDMVRNPLDKIPWRWRNTSGDQPETLSDEEGALNYNYSNPNDEEFCTSIHEEGGGEGGEIDEGMEDDGLPSSQEEFAGENLLPVPYRVENIELTVPKRDKRMNMRKLKAATWAILTDAEHVDKPTIAMGMEWADHLPNSMTRKMSFPNLYKELLDKLPSKMSSNLSVALSFVCLLHLANEKILSLSNTDSGEVIIQQGTVCTFPTLAQEIMRFS